MIEHVYLLTEHPIDATGYIQHLRVRYGDPNVIESVIVGGKSDKHLYFDSIDRDGILNFTTVYPRDSDPLCCPSGKGTHHVFVFPDRVIESDTLVGLRTKKFQYTQQKVKEALGFFTQFDSSSFCSLVELIPYYWWLSKSKIITTKTHLQLAPAQQTYVYTARVLTENGLHDCQVASLEEFYEK
ncbi:hypothetical protein [Photobacterium sp. DNB22_13_2]